MSSIAILALGAGASLEAASVRLDFRGTVNRVNDGSGAVSAAGLTRRSPISYSILVDLGQDGYRDLSAGGQELIGDIPLRESFYTDALSPSPIRNQLGPGTHHPIAEYHTGFIGDDFGMQFVVGTGAESINITNFDVGFAAQDMDGDGVEDWRDLNPNDASLGLSDHLTLQPWIGSTFDVFNTADLLHPDGQSSISGQVTLVAVTVIPAPEPTSMLLLAAGSMGLLAARRRRR